jgi:hypothetical protein
MKQEPHALGVGAVRKTSDPSIGLEVKRAVYLSEDKVLELLRNMKKEKEEKAKMGEIQKIAGSVDGHEPKRTKAFRIAF